jgi:WD40 repeat protein
MCVSRLRCTVSACTGTTALVFILWACQTWPPMSRAQDAAKTPEAKKEAPDEKTIRALIAQLGDASFQVREAAGKRLVSIGEPAFDPLEKTVRESTDPEVRDAADLLIKEISKGLFSQVRRFEGRHEGKETWVTRIVVTPDGRRAVSVGSDALRCWDLASGKQIASFDSKGIESWGLAISADGKKAIAGSHNNEVRVCDLTTGKEIATFMGHTGSVWGVALSRDGKQAISAGGDRIIRVWDVPTGQELRTFERADDDIRCLARLPDGKLIATGHFAGDSEPGVVRLWNFETGKEIREMRGHKEAVTSVAFAPNGKTLVSTSWDKSVRLWDVATGKELKSFLGHTNVAECAVFTSDGSRLVSSGNIFNPSLRIWDVATGKQLFESAPVRDGFFCVATVPNSRQCVSAGRDGVVRLWQWKR